jgi:hypothetical protein
VLGTQREPGLHLPHWTEGLKSYLRSRVAA